jgi:hypothetical protein
MRIEDQRHEFINTAARSVDPLAISEAERQLKPLLGAIEDLDDPDIAEKYRRELARKGLELEQKMVPRLAALASKILDAAGAKAIRDVCEPIQRVDRQGRPETFTWTGEKMPPLKTGFTVPERFKSKVATVVEKVLGR